MSPPPTDVVNQAKSHLITDLEPGTKYEATVQSRNRYGWSEISEVFNFTTRNKNGKNLEY